MDPTERLALRKWLAMYKSAGAALGDRNWRLLCSYGRVMCGPHGGLYVSGIPMPAAQAFIAALLRGEEIPVHLMHRHRSGNYESSSLRLVDGQLVMRFDDRTELA